MTIANEPAPVESAEPETNVPRSMTCGPRQASACFFGAFGAFAGLSPLGRGGLPWFGEAVAAATETPSAAITSVSTSALSFIWETSGRVRGLLGRPSRTRRRLPLTACSRKPLVRGSRGEGAAEPSRFSRKRGEGRLAAPFAEPAVNQLRLLDLDGGSCLLELALDRVGLVASDGLLDRL